MWRRQWLTRVPTSNPDGKLIVVTDEAYAKKNSAKMEKLVSVLLFAMTCDVVFTVPCVRVL